MSYLVSQLWLCLLLALLLGSLVGWFLRGGCKNKLAKISGDWEQRYLLLENEKKLLASKAQDSKRFNNERKSLMSRLTAMENGANLASNVLKENKDKLDEAEQSLSALKLELQQRDVDIRELKNTSNDSSERIGSIIGASSAHEEKAIKTQGLLDLQISKSKALKLKSEQTLVVKNEEVEKLVLELQKTQEESMSNYDQLETLQALLEAHEEGSNSLSKKNKKLKKSLSTAESLILEYQGKLTQLNTDSDRNKKAQKEIELALNMEIEALKNTFNTSKKELEQLSKQSAIYKEEAKQCQHSLDDQIKNSAALKLSVEKSSHDFNEKITLKNTELEKLAEALNVAKEELVVQSHETESLQASLEEQKTSNQLQSEKEAKLVKALSLSDKMNVDYEKKTSEFISQLALKDEKINEVKVSLSDKEQELATVESQVAEIKILIDEYEKSSQSMLGKLSRLESQSNAYRVELLDTESKLKVTEELVANKEKEANDKFADLALKLQESEDNAQFIRSSLSDNESKVAQKSKEKSICDKEVLQLKDHLSLKKAEIKDLKNNLSEQQDRLKSSEAERKSLEIESEGKNIPIKKVVIKSVSKAIVKPQSFVSTTKKSVITPNQAIDYDIETIEGIGKSYGAKLRKLDISKTSHLLDKAVSVANIDDIATQLKQKNWLVRSWMSMSDLLRVRGVDGQYAELLEFSGIHSVQSLAKQTAKPLSKKMFLLNEKEHRVKTAPEAETVAEWIIYATTLSPLLADDLESIQKESKLEVKAPTAIAVSSEDNTQQKNAKKNDCDIEEIDGIGKGYGKRLRAMGIHTTTKLLNKCANTNYAKNIAEVMTLNEKIVKSWCQMADLIRVDGVDGQLADLLFCSGISSVKELSIQDENKLTGKIESVNTAQQRVKETPVKEVISGWIVSAKLLRAEDA